MTEKTETQQLADAARRLVTTKTTTATWMNQGGRIVCARHGGAALAHAIEAHPRRMTHTTDLDIWTRVTSEMVTVWTQMFGAEAARETATCETCRINAMKEARR